MGRFYIGDDDDEMSGDQILGDDDLDFGDDELDALLSGDQILGADKKRRVKNAVNTAARALVARSKQVVVRGNNVMMSQIMPLPIVSVATTVVAVITAKPQWTIRVERLVIPSWVARFFDVTQFNVGQLPQYVNTGSVNGTIFSEVAIGVRLKGDTANLGNEVTLAVQNIDAPDTHEFRGTIFGTVLKP